MKRERGFTLIELMIAITLVAAISAGLLTAMRNGLLTMQRTQDRLEQARRAIGVQDLVRRQIGGAMPVIGMCSRDQAQGLAPIFRGDESQLLLVSSQSSAEGARGAPKILYYSVRANPDATYRLEMIELPYTGQWSTLAACDPAVQVVRPPAVPARPVLLYDHLAACRFLYRNLSFDTLLSVNPWQARWANAYLPFAVRIEMVAAPNADTRMPVGPITIPLHISRGPGERYADE